MIGIRTIILIEYPHSFEINIYSNLLFKISDSKKKILKKFTINKKFISEHVLLFLIIIN